MATPSIGVVLPMTAERLRRPLPDDVGAFGAFAEDLGYESVWATERGSDSVVDLTEIAIATERIRVGTSVLNVFTRSPLELASSGASLDRVSGGRAVLGVGASHPEKVVDLHGLAYDQPYHRLREAIELIRGHTAGSTFDYDGEVFEMTALPSRDVDLPVYVGALGEATRRLTGALGDGWLPYNIPFPKLQDSFEAVAEGARRAGRDPRSIEVAPLVPAVVSDDPDAARREVRVLIADFAGGFGDDTYKLAMAEQFPEESERIARLWRSGDRDAAIEAVPDPMVDALGVAGTPASARERLRELLDREVVDLPLLKFPYGADEELVRRTMRELRPEKL